MREILFRGKRTDGMGWIEGYYANCCYPNRDKNRIYHLIIEYPNNYYEIYTGTLGQYTGLTDKNGKKIFEGDIVKLASVLSTGVVTYHLYKFMVDDIDDGMQNYSSDMWEECKVIGNIFDNPELLKESE